MKIIVWYHRKMHGLYAFSDDKKLTKLFRNQRNMNLFIEKKIDISYDEYTNFELEHQELKIVLDYVEDENDATIKIAATIKESNDLNEYCDSIAWVFNSIINKAKEIRLKNKYMDTLYDIRDSVFNKNEYRINTFSLFYYLYKNTFIDIEEEFECLE